MPHRCRAPRGRLIALGISAGLIGPLPSCVSPAQHVAAGLSTSPARQTPAHPAVAVASIAITVSDLDTATAWYRDVLGFTPVASPITLGGEPFERLVGTFGATARVQELALGLERIELIEFLTPRGRPFPGDTRSNDLWFQHIAVIVRDMDEAYAHLRRSGVTHASQGPQRLPDWNVNAGGVRAFYFRDPDGHFLEVLEFPSGKGEQRWQSDERLFLGIDHTAIVVDDTEASLGFYRDMLGFEVAGESENFGPEQERLNAVFPARLRITSLRAPNGPAIELLEYLTPRDGRPIPLDSRPSDLWHWHVVIESGDADALFTACRGAGGRPISPGAQANSLGHGEGRGLMARDPDGHALLFVKTRE